MRALGSIQKLGTSPRSVPRSTLPRIDLWVRRGAKMSRPIGAGEHHAKKAPTGHAHRTHAPGRIARSAKPRPPLPSERSWKTRACPRKGGFVVVTTRGQAVDAAKQIIGRSCAFLADRRTPVLVVATSLGVPYAQERTALGAVLEVPLPAVFHLPAIGTPDSFRHSADGGVGFYFLHLYLFILPAPRGQPPRDHAGPPSTDKLLADSHCPNRVRRCPDPRDPHCTPL